MVETILRFGMLAPPGESRKTPTHLDHNRRCIYTRPQSVYA